MVVGGAEGLVQGEREERQPGSEVPGRVAGVEDGDGGGEQPLRPTELISQHHDGFVNLVPSEGVHGQIVDGIGQIKQRAVGPVGGRDEPVRVLRAEALPKVGYVVGLRGEGAFHVPGQGPGEGPDAVGEMLELLCSDLFVGLNSFGGPSGGHAGDVAGVVDGETPALSGLVPAAVGGVGAEDEEQP